MENNKVWAKSTEEKLSSLLADEAKGAAMLNELNNSIKQLRAKSSFRLALINQLLENERENK